MKYRPSKKDLVIAFLAGATSFLSIDKISSREDVPQTPVVGSFVYETEINPDSLDELIENEKFKGKKNRRAFADKVGFKYSVDNLIYKPKIPGAPAIGLFHDALGITYSFEIEDGYPGVSFELMLACNNGSTFSDSFLFMDDENQDGKLDRVSIRDEKNNYSTVIKRSGRGVLEYEDNCNEELAKTLYKFATLEYRNFMQEHDIMEKIEDYRITLEFRKTIPHENGIVDPETTKGIKDSFRLEYKGD